MDCQGKSEGGRARYGEVTVNELILATPPKERVA